MAKIARLALWKICRGAPDKPEQLVARGFDLVFVDDSPMPLVKETKHELDFDNAEQLHAHLTVGDWLAPVPPALMAEVDPTVIQVWMPKALVLDALHSLLSGRAGTT